MDAAVTPNQRFEQDYVRPRVGRTLIIGSKLYPGRPDRRALYPDAVGLDMQEGDGVDVVCDLEQPLEIGLGKFAHIECMSVLEHCRQPWVVADNIELLMEDGGTLFVAAPFVHEFHAYPQDFWRFTTKGLESLFSQVKFDQLALSHKKLTFRDRLGRIRVDGFPYFPRCEVLGFGHK